MNRNIQRAAAILSLLICAVSHAAVNEPFLELKLSVPRILKTLELIVPEEAKADEAFTSTIKSVRDLNLSSAYLFLYPDEDFKSLPILMVTSPEPSALQNLLAQDGILSAYFDKTTSSSYKVKAEFLTNEALEDLPLDEYRIWISKKTLLFAPISTVKSWKTGVPKPMASRVAKTAATLQTKGLAFACAVQIPEEISSTDWDDISSELPIPAGEESDMITGVGTDLISEMSDAFSTIDSFAFGFQLGANKQRVIEYTQQFRETANVVELFKQITTGGTDEATDLIDILANVVKSDSVKMVPTLKGKALSLQLSWDPSADQDVIESIGGYLMGKIMSAAMGGMEMTMGSSDDDGPVNTVHIPEPNIDTSVDMSSLKTSLKKQLEANAFPGHYWKNGEAPYMQYNFDYLQYPNAGLCKLNYDVVSVISPDGSSIRGKGAENSSRKVWNRPNSPSMINIPIAKGTPPEELDKAVVRWTLSAPSTVISFDLTPESKGTSITKDGIQITLKNVGKHSATVTFKGCESVKIFALDETGQYISQQSSSWGDRFISASFAGNISSLKAVGIKAMTDITIDTTLDLNKGALLELPDKPSAVVRTRYSYEAAPSYREYTSEEIADLKVEWDDDKDRPADLKISFNEPTVKCDYKWKVCYFAKDKAKLLKGNGGSNSGFMGKGARVMWYARDAKDADIHGAYGHVDITVPETISVLTLNKSSDGKPTEQITSSGLKVTAAFTNNVVAVTFPQDNMLNLQAFDATGGQLKQEDSDYTNNGRTYKYWGQPANIVMHMADKRITRKLNIDLTKDGIDANAYDTFKTQINSISSTAETMTAVDKAKGQRGNNWTDGTIAGLYYLLDHTGKQNKLIDLEIAHSDPSGAVRYGYTVKPHCGYYFTTAKGSKKDGKSTDYPKDDKELTLKWEKGEFNTKRFDRDLPALIAIPADKSAPCFMYSWGKLNVSFESSKTLDYIPEGAWPKGWVDISEIPYLGK